MSPGLKGSLRQVRKHSSPLAGSQNLPQGQDWGCGRTPRGPSLFSRWRRPLGCWLHLLGCLSQKSQTSGSSHRNSLLTVRGLEAQYQGARAFGFWWGATPGVQIAAFSLCPPVAESARDSKLSGVSSYMGTPPSGPHGPPNSPPGPLSKYHHVRGCTSTRGPGRGTPFSSQQTLFVLTLVFRQ